MKISFLDFWGGFDPNNNFLINILKRYMNGVVLTNPDEADIIFCSIFGQSHSQFFNKKDIILFSGENIRPNYSTYNKSLTFDFYDYDNRNVRLPLWYFYIDWFNIKTYNNPEYLIPENYLYNENEFTIKSKSKFCSTVFSKSDNDRIEMMKILSEYKNVDGFGKVHLNKISEGEKAKLDIISDYKFSICFENSIYPGYFTEKLLHAKIAGTIPIYKSHESFSEDFNPNCCLNLINLDKIEIFNLVKEIDTNQNLYKKFLDEPLFSSKIDIDIIGKKIINML